MHYDVVIIGGGIQGAGVAQVCAVNGLKVLLLEQGKLASGTSSRSSKLIHGGLRYLESFQFGLVNECLRERQTLLQIAPDLVRLVPFYIPVYRDTSRGSLKIRTGLSLYAVLGGLGRDCRFSTVPRSEYEKLDGLNTSKLKKIFRYHDAQTSDDLLTRAVAESALSHDAEIIEQAVVTGGQPEGNSYRICYHKGSLDHEVTATCVVNASGPWVNDVLALISDSEPLAVDLVQGTHLLIDATLEKGIYYVEAPRDRRAVFIMPYHGKVLVGTTETLYEGNPGDVAPLDEEQQYLLETMHHYFPQLAQAEVLDRFAGLRVLPATGDSPFRRSRDTSLVADDLRQPRLISIYGGKLTAYRKTAERVFRLICNTIPPAGEIVNTNSINLYPPEEL